jgi:uncharacterized protein
MLLGASASFQANAETRGQVSATNKAHVAQALNAWMDGRGSITDLFAPAIRWTIVGNTLVSGTTVGKGQVIKRILKPFGERFSRSKEKFHPTVIRGLYSDGDVVVAVFDGRGVDNNGKPYINTYAWILTLRDGLVVEATAFFDSLAFNELWRTVRPVP